MVIINGSIPFIETIQRSWFDSTRVHILEIWCKLVAMYALGAYTVKV